METGLEGRPWYLGLAIGALVGAAVLGFGYRSKISPMNKEIARQESRLVELQAQIQRGEEAEAQLPQFEERVGRLELELAKLLKILPNRRNVHELLGRFRSVAEQEDFNLTKVTPGTEVEQEYFSEWPISVSVEGTYHNLARFFDRMSRFTRIINIDSLKINAARSATPTLSITASFVAKTFVYKDTEASGGGP